MKRFISASVEIKEDGKVLLTEGESDPLEAELEDGNLVIEQDGGKMIFEKK